MNKNKAKIYAVAMLLVVVAAILLRFTYLNSEDVRDSHITDEAAVPEDEASVATPQESFAGLGEQACVGYAQAFIAQSSPQVYKDSGDGAFPGSQIDRKSVV